MTEIDVIESLYLCRCCLWRPPDKDLMKPYTFLGKSEIFAEMLTKCFDIRLPLDDDDECGICEVCVGRLRDASDFKLQVQRSQAELKAQLRKVLRAMDQVPEAKAKLTQKEAKVTVDDDVILISGESAASETEMPAGAFSDEDAAKPAWDSAADSQAGPRLPLSAGARELLTMAYNMNHESLSDIKDLHNNPDFCPNETPQEKNRTRNTNAERISPNQKLNKKKKQRFRENQFSDKNNLITHSLTHTVNEQKSAPNVDETYHSVFDKWEKEYTSKLNLKRKFLKCNTCLKRFAQKEALDNHLLFDCFEYFCDFCKRGFQTKHKLIHHMSLHMGIKTCEICQKDPRNMKKYFCGSCHKGFINKPMLSKHLLTHAKRKSYACEVCNKEFRYKTQFHIHLLTPGHFSRRHEEFKSKEHMNTHVSEKRFSEKLAVMNLLKQPSDVSIQYLSKKEYKCKEISDSRPKSQATQYFCHTCKIQFTKKEEFLNHKCKKEYYCNFCSMCFTQKTVLTNHIRTHTGDKPYSCDICHKRFGRTHVLKMHKLIHSGLKPHSCNICNKQFRLKTALKNHVQRLHTAIKPYACDVCFKRFTRSFELKYHYRTHTGEKPNICEICQMKFTQPNAVRRHIIRVHVGETYRIHKT